MAHLGLAALTWDEREIAAANVRLSNRKLKAAGYRLVRPGFEF